MESSGSRSSVWRSEFDTHPVEKFMQTIQQYTPEAGRPKPPNLEVLSTKALYAVCKTLYEPKPLGLGLPFPE